MSETLSTETPRPGCKRCKHLCALAVDRSDNFRQCGNPRCPKYGQWSESWVDTLSRMVEAKNKGLTIEPKPCEFFEAAQSLVPFGTGIVSSGFAKAWGESVKRLAEYFEFRRERLKAEHRGEPPPPRPQSPADIHPLGLPDKWFARSYVRVYPDGKD